MYSTTDNIKTALKLAWKHKIIWIFALLIGSGGGMNFNNVGDFSEIKDFRPDNEYNVELDSQADAQQMSYTFSPGSNDSNQFKDILGARAQADAPNFMESLEQVELVVPGIIIGLSFVIFLSYLIIVGFLLQGWAKSAAIAGTFKGLYEKKLNLKNLGRIARANMFKFINTEITAIILISVVSLLTLIIFGGLIFLPSVINAPAALFIIPGVLFLLTGMVYAVIIKIGLLFSFRNLVSNETSSRDAIKFGVKTLRSNSWKFIKLALLNFLLIILGLIGFTIIIVSTTALITLIFSFGSGEGISSVLLILGGILAVPFMIGVGIATQVLWGYVRTYLEFTYTILYLHTQNIDDARTVNLIGDESGN